MGTRAQELARKFEFANREFIETVESVSDEEWTNVCPAENWTIGVTAHHVAYDYPILVDVMQTLNAGESKPLTMQMIDELNADHARQHADCSKAGTLDLLRTDGEKAASAIRELDDEALDRRHQLPFLGIEPVPLETFINVALIEHHNAHLPSIRAASPSLPRARTG